MGKGKRCVYINWRGCLELFSRACVDGLPLGPFQIKQNIMSLLSDIYYAVPTISGQPTTTNERERSSRYSSRMAGSPPPIIQIREDRSDWLNASDRLLGFVK